MLEYIFGRRVVYQIVEDLKAYFGNKLLEPYFCLITTFFRVFNQNKD